jgi:hypothetical protein
MQNLWKQNDLQLTMSVTEKEAKTSKSHLCLHSVSLSTILKP